MSEETWLTIVTVHKDDQRGLDRTLGSVAPQDLTGVEVLVIDGSADRGRTVDTVRSSGIEPVRLDWSEPHGIYAAMNTGLGLAQGRYVYYVNAGDLLHDDDVLRLVRGLVAEDPVWVFGQVCFVAEDGSRVVPPPFDYADEQRHAFSRGRFPPHQATIASRETLQDLGGFDLTFAIAADYAAFLKLSLVADPVQADSVLADFFEGGVSSRRWRASIGEFHRARREVLNLSGQAALRETVATGAQFARMSAARAVQSVRGTGR